MTHSSKKYISILLALLYLMVSMPALASSAEECTHINFENGLCADCGTPCSHPENHYIDASENLSNYTSVDNSQHLVTYSNYTFIKCGLCEQEVPGTRSEPATQSLPMCHTYNDAGVCDSCGHTNTCTHSDTRAVPAQSNMHDYVSVSSTQHSYKCDWYESL